MTQQAQPSDWLDQPTFDLHQARRLVSAQLSSGARGIYTLMLCVSLFSTVAVSSLWATEPGLPMRTQLAFLSLVAIGSAWSIFFAWTLAQRRPLFALHRVFSGRLAVSASCVFALGALLLATVSPDLRQGALMAASLGGVLVLVAGLYLGQARRKHRELVMLLGRLESRLG